MNHRLERLAYSISEGAHALGIGRTKMLQLLAKKEVRSLRVGRRVLIPREALEEFLRHTPRDAR